MQDINIQMTIIFQSGSMISDETKVAANWSASRLSISRIDHEISIDAITPRARIGALNSTRYQALNVRHCTAIINNTPNSSFRSSQPISTQARMLEAEAPLVPIVSQLRTRRTSQLRIFSLFDVQTVVVSDTMLLFSYGKGVVGGVANS